MAVTASPVTQSTQQIVSPIIGVIQSSRSWDPSGGSGNPLFGFLTKGNKIVSTGCRRQPKECLLRDEARRQGIKWNGDECGKTSHLTADVLSVVFSTWIIVWRIDSITGIMWEELVLHLGSNCTLFWPKLE